MNLGYNAYHHPGEGINSIVFRRWDIYHGDHNSILGIGSISQDENLRIWLDDPNAGAGQEMINISQEKREDDIGGSDDIQMVYAESNSVVNTHL